MFRQQEFIEFHLAMFTLQQLFFLFFINILSFSLCLRVNKSSLSPYGNWLSSGSKRTTCQRVICMQKYFCNIHWMIKKWECYQASTHLQVLFAYSIQKFDHKLDVSGFALHWNSRFYQQSNVSIHRNKLNLMIPFYWSNIKIISAPKNSYCFPSPRQLTLEILLSCYKLYRECRIKPNI